MKYPLGELVRVEDLRSVWIGEATDFTPWLATGGLALLSKAIGLELELEGTEQDVGPYRADVVCRDTVNGNMVLIENQLEKTNHSHLGQLITYAAGLKAVTIVWVAYPFTEEHRAALDWLNDVTSEDVNFFGLEIELWKIGNSLSAPKLNIVSKPNDWKKTLASIRQLSGHDELTETKRLHVEYWTELKSYLEARNSSVRPRTPQPQHWYDFAIGRSYIFLRAQTGMRDGYIMLQLVLADDDAKKYFALLLRDREAVDAEIGVPLEWREMPENKQSDISLYRYDVDPTNRENWADYHAWLHTYLERFYKAFHQRVKNLNLEDYTPIESDLDEGDDIQGV